MAESPSKETAKKVACPERFELPTFWVRRLRECIAPASPAIRSKKSWIAKSTLVREHRVQYWPVFLLSNAEHVGCAGLRPYKAEQKIYELGFHMRAA
jgi:hypothetical protein